MRLRSPWRYQLPKTLKQIFWIWTIFRLLSKNSLWSVSSGILLSYRILHSGNCLNMNTFLMNFTFAEWISGYFFIGILYFVHICGFLPFIQRYFSESYMNQASMQILFLCWWILLDSFTPSLIPWFIEIKTIRKEPWSRLHYFSHTVLHNSTTIGDDLFPCKTQRQ